MLTADDRMKRRDQCLNVCVCARVINWEKKIKIKPASLSYHLRLWCSSFGFDSPQKTLKPLENAVYELDLHMKFVCLYTFFWRCHKCFPACVCKQIRLRAFEIFHRSNAGLMPLLSDQRIQGLLSLPLMEECIWMFACISPSLSPRFKGEESVGYQQ